MSAGLTTYGAANWSQLLFGLVSVPTQYYLALCTSEPGQGWDGTILTSAEPSGMAYARQQIPCTSAWWQQDNNYVTNLQPISFPVPTGDWGVITHYALCSAATNGNVYMYSNFIRPLRLDENYAVVIPAGALNLTLDTYGGSYNA